MSENPLKLEGTFMSRYSYWSHIPIQVSSVADVRNVSCQPDIEAFSDQRTSRPPLTTKDSTSSQYTRSIRAISTIVGQLDHFPSSVRDLPTHWTEREMASPPLSTNDHSSSTGIPASSNMNINSSINDDPFDPNKNNNHPNISATSPKQIKQAEMSKRLGKTELFDQEGNLISKYFKRVSFHCKVHPTVTEEEYL